MGILGGGVPPGSPNPDPGPVTGRAYKWGGGGMMEDYKQQFTVTEKQNIETFHCRKGHSFWNITGAGVSYL